MSHELSLAELDAENAELLPAREALGMFSYSSVKSNWANIAASNTSIALNGGGFGSSATAFAQQTIFVVQH